MLESPSGMDSVQLVAGTVSVGGLVLGLSVADDHFMKGISFVGGLKASSIPAKPSN
jgi:hypothetical protein